MLTFLERILGNPALRWLVLLASNAAFFAGGWAIHGYIDESARSVGLAFLLIVLWMMGALVNGLISVFALGERLFYRGFIERSFQGAPEDPEDEDDEVLAGRALTDVDSKIVIYILVVATGVLITSDRLAGGFMSWFQHPGFSVLMMRSDEPADRRTGLVSLTEKLDFDAGPEVQAVVRAALDDPDEGVAARAAFAAGELRVAGAEDGLIEMATSRPALTFTALIALGQLPRDGVSRARLKALANTPEAREEPRALAFMLGLQRVRAIERLRQIYAEFQPSGRRAGTAAVDDGDVRMAAIWALGELREPKLVDVIAGALEDPSLAVRCAASDALEKLAVLESAPPLRAAFEAANDPELHCPEKTIPTQEGGTTYVVVKYRNYELGLVRALATTDDPRLIPWLVKQQEGRAYGTHVLMRKLYERLKQRDDAGELNSIKRRIRQLEVLEASARDAGGAPPDAAPPK